MHVFVYMFVCVCPVCVYRVYLLCMLGVGGGGGGGSISNGTLEAAEGADWPLGPRLLGDQAPPQKRAPRGGGR